MQVKTAVWYHFTPVRMMINPKELAGIGEDRETRECLYTGGGNLNWCSHCGK